MDPNQLPHNDGNPFDQYFDDDNSNTQQAQPEPRQRPAHLAMHNPTDTTQPTPDQQTKAPTAATRPGETVPAKPIHHNIPSDQQLVDDPQAAINEALMQHEQMDGQQAQGQVTQLPSQEVPTVITQAEQPPQQTMQQTPPNTEPTSTVPEKQVSPTVQTQAIQEEPIFQEPPEQTKPRPKVDYSGLPPSRTEMTVRKIVVGLIIFTLMVVVGIIGVMYAKGGTSAVLLPFQDTVQNLPFVPKSDFQVFASAINAETAISSYDYVVNVSLEMNSPTQTDQSANMQLTGNGSVHANADTSHTSSFTGSYTTSGSENGSVEFSIINDDTDLYVKINSLQDAMSSMQDWLPQVGTWYIYSLDQTTYESLGGEAVTGQDYTDLKDTITISADERDQLITLFGDSQAIKDSISLESNITLQDGTKAYHLSITPTTDALVDIFTAVSEKNGDTFSADEITQLRSIFDGFETLRGDLWIEKDTYIIRKMSLDFVYQFDPSDFESIDPLVFEHSMPLVGSASRVLADTDSSEKVTGSFSLEYMNINNGTPIQIPIDTKPFEDYLQSQQLSYGFSYNPSIDQATAISNAETKTDLVQIGTALQMYAQENGGTYPSTLDGLVDKLYLATVPRSNDTRDPFCETTYQYLVSDDTKSALVWTDLEPCDIDQTQETNAIYATSCGTVVVKEGTTPTADTLETGFICN